MVNGAIKTIILDAIASDNFVVSKLTDVYSRDKLAAAIVAIVEDIRTNSNNMQSHFSDSELQNFYLLSANIMVQKTIEEGSVKDMNLNKTTRHSRALIPKWAIDYMYQLKPAL